MAHWIVAPTVTFEHSALAAPVTLSQTPEACTVGYDEADGTFARFWPTSLVLSRFFCAHPELVAGKRIVELGAGSGAVGLVCAALGAASVTLTDVPEAMGLIARNIELNPHLHSVRAAPCTWGCADHMEALLREDGPYDVVLSCEVVYQQAREVLEALAHTQRALVRPSGLALVGYEFRGAMMDDLAYFDAVDDLFPGDCVSHHLKTHSVAASAHMGEHEDDGEDDRFLYVYTAPAGAAASAPRLSQEDATTADSGQGLNQAATAAATDGVHGADNVAPPR